MNWEAISAVGDLVSAIAVVVTLIFLTLQLRENTKSIRVQAVDTTFKEWSEMLKEIQSVDDVGLIYFKTLKGETLTELEDYQLTFLYRRMFNNYAKWHYRGSTGFSDPFIDENMVKSLRAITGVEFFSKWWSVHRYHYAESFQQYLDEFIAARNRQ